MKHSSITIFAVAALSAALALADSSSSTPTPPSPAQIAAQEVARLTTLLTLSSAQQTTATTIFTTEETTLATIHTSLQTARSALKTAVQSDDVTTIDAQAAEIGTLTGEAVKAQGEADGAFFVLLTTPQQTIYNELRNGPGPGGHGGPGGPGGGVPGGGPGFGHP